MEKELPTSYLEKSCDSRTTALSAHGRGLCRRRLRADHWSDSLEMCSERSRGGEFIHPAPDMQGQLCSFRGQAAVPADDVVARDSFPDSGRGQPHFRCASIRGNAQVVEGVRELTSENPVPKARQLRRRDPPDAVRGLSSVASSSANSRTSSSSFPTSPGLPPSPLSRHLCFFLPCCAGPLSCPPAGA
jgi:hypothetical protein